MARENYNFNNTGFNMHQDGSSIQDKIIFDLQQNQKAVSIYLINGIQLRGIITETNQDTIVLDGKVPQIIYKHAISTIVPK